MTRYDYPPRTWRDIAIPVSLAIILAAIAAVTIIPVFV